jgi:NAD(P)-dependent dehydrogenase (short-subunit alcohol dehydrogenase family)
MTRSVARELGGKGVTANVVAPGFIQTDMTKRPPRRRHRLDQEHDPSAELGEPEDIAAAVAYVTSDDAGFLTGQVIAVDGGMTMC